MRKWSLSDSSSLLAALATDDAQKAWSQGLAILAEWGLTPSENSEQDARLTVVGKELTVSFLGGNDLSEEVTDFLSQVLQVALVRLADKKARELAVERAEMLSHASFEGILIHDGGVILDMNDRITDMSGWTREDFVGQQAVLKAAAPEDHEEIFRRIQRAEEGSYLINSVRKDGSRFHAELQSKQGRLGERPVRVTAIRDVTEREKTLSLMRESERRISELSNAIFDLTVLSRDGVMLSAHGPLLDSLAYGPSDLIGKKILDFIAPSSRPLVKRQVGGSLSGRYETTLVDKAGALVPVEVIAINSTHEGLPIRVAGIRDLRPQRRQEVERYALQQRVERAHRLESLGLLSGGIAHDFNNLLVSVLGNAELLLDDAKDEDSQQMLQAILIAAERGSELTSRLLAYAGRGDVAPTATFSVSELVRGLVQLFPAREASTPVFQANIQADCSIAGDRASLTQVLLNLFTNALDATQAKAKEDGADPHPVLVSVEEISEPDERWEEALGATIAPGNWVLIEVRDYGVGMDDATQARVFEPFFTTKSKGHGLGMAACLGIVEHHRGALHLRSERGKGSCFSLLLPTSKATSQRPSALPRGGSSYRVLVVDDESMVREQIRRSLSLRGHAVVEAESGSACLEKLTDGAFDVVLLDIRMPNMSGVDVLREIRARGLEVPVVFVSGYFDEQQEKELVGMSFQGFLTKPYTIDGLTSAIEHARSVVA